MINDDRNGSYYSCVTVSSTVSQPTLANIIDESDPFFLYVAGEYQHIYMYILTKSNISIQLYDISILCWLSGGYSGFNGCTIHYAGCMVVVEVVRVVGAILLLIRIILLLKGFRLWSEESLNLNGY